MAKNRDNLSKKTLDTLAKIKKIKPADSHRLTTLSPYKYSNSLNNTLGLSQNLGLKSRESSVLIKPSQDTTVFSQESTKIMQDEESKAQEYGLSQVNNLSREIYSLRRKQNELISERKADKALSSYRNYTNSILRSENNDLSKRDTPSLKLLRRDKPRVSMHESFDIRQHTNHTENIVIRSASKKLDAFSNLNNPKSVAEKFKREVQYTSHLPKINNLKSKIIQSYAEMLPSVFKDSSSQYKSQINGNTTNTKLAQIKNTVIVNYGGFSEGGFNPRVIKKENQDSFLTLVNFNKSHTTNSHLFSICKCAKVNI